MGDGGTVLHNRRPLAPICPGWFGRAGKVPLVVLVCGEAAYPTCLGPHVAAELRDHRVERWRRNECSTRRR